MFSRSRGALREVLEDCSQYRLGALPLEHLRASIWHASDTMDTPDEGEMIDLMHDTYRGLETLGDELSGGEVSYSILEIVTELESRIQLYLDES